MVYRLGFGSIKKRARQLVNHGHLMINGRKVKAPGALVKAGDSIEVREKSRELIPFRAHWRQSSTVVVFRNGLS